jgi:YfiH family protein
MVLGRGHAIDAKNEAASIAHLLGCPAQNVVTLQQVHGALVHRLDGPPGHSLEGDGLFTYTRGLVLVVRTADCLPVFFSNAGERPVAGIVHAGWRGLDHQIIRIALDQAKARSGQLAVWFGPAIGADVYEVGPEVAERFSAVAKADRPNKFYLDLCAQAKQQLPRGTDPDTEWNECTYKNRDFYSHRRGDAGRNYNLIWME